MYYKIKPPEWKLIDGIWCWRASIHILYEVQQFPEKIEWFIHRIGVAQHPSIKKCDSIDHGKALAEADWITRTVPALVPVEIPPFNFDQYYVENVHDLEAEPLGSRLCGYMRKAWNAALLVSMLVSKEDIDMLNERLAERTSGLLARHGEDIKARQNVEAVNRDLLEALTSLIPFLDFETPELHADYCMLQAKEPEEQDWDGCDCGLTERIKAALALISEQKSQTLAPVA